MECYERADNEGTKGHPKKIKIMKDVNGDELELSLLIVVMEIDERVKIFYKTMKNIMEITLDDLSIYSTKFNPISPIIRLYKKHRNHF